jgi:protein unc-45
VKEQGMQKIEVYTYSEHELLKRAASQCLVNLVLSPEVVNLYEGENDRTKLLVLLAQEEDLETCKAATGALAILLSASPKCADKVLKVGSWQESLTYMLANPDPDIQHRGLVAVHGLIASSKENAAEVVGTDILELILAHSQNSKYFMWRVYFWLFQIWPKVIDLNFNSNISFCS